MKNQCVAYIILCSLSLYTNASQLTARNTSGNKGTQKKTNEKDKLNTYQGIYQQMTKKHPQLSYGELVQEVEEENRRFTSLLSRMRRRRLISDKIKDTCRRLERKIELNKIFLEMDKQKTEQSCPGLSKSLSLKYIISDFRSARTLRQAQGERIKKLFFTDNSQV